MRCLSPCCGRGSPSRCRSPRLTVVDLGGFFYGCSGGDGVVSFGVVRRTGFKAPPSCSPRGHERTEGLHTRLERLGGSLSLPIAATCISAKGNSPHSPMPDRLALGSCTCFSTNSASWELSISATMPRSGYPFYDHALATSPHLTSVAFPCP